MFFDRIFRLKMYLLTCVKYIYAFGNNPFSIRNKGRRYPNCINVWFKSCTHHHSKLKVNLSINWHNPHQTWQYPFTSLFCFHMYCIFETVNARRKQVSSYRLNTLSFFFYQINSHNFISIQNSNWLFTKKE